MVRAPRIGLYFTSVDRISYLIAKTLALGGCRVFVRFEIPLAELLAGPNEPGFAERDYCSWLFSEDEIEVVPNCAAAPEVDGLLYELRHCLPRYPDELSAWMARAGTVVAWNTNHHEHAWWPNLRAELAGAVRHARFLLSTRRVVISNGRTFLRPTDWLGRGCRQGYFTHPKFLREPALHAEMFEGSWSPDEERPVRLIFSGNAQPALRTRLVEEVRTFIQRSPGVRFLNHYKEVLSLPESSAAATTVLWMVRAAVQDPQWYLRRDVVPPAEWPAVMRQCDFALCPPGYERKTHRVVESLLQGVVPILDCPEEYDLGLHDGVHCFVVKNGRWQAAVQRALDMPQEDVVRMRRALWALAKAELRPNGASLHWLKRLGLDSRTR